MKLENRKFNKILGTEFRTKNLLNYYIQLAYWISEQKAENLNDEEFRKFVNKCGFYKYRTMKTIDRLKMIILRLQNNFKLIKRNEDNTYSLTFNTLEGIENSILNALAKTEENFKEKDNETCMAFKAMLDFMVENPNKNDAKKIFHSFSVYEHNDVFSELYEKDIIEEIVKNAMKKRGYDVLNDISNGKIISKPMNIKKICKKILRNKENLEISNEEFKKAKPSFLTNFKNIDEFKLFVKNNSYEDIAQTIIRNRTKKNFNGEFFDLFNRLLFDLGISISSGKKVEKYENKKIKKENNRYYVAKNHDVAKYPFTIDEVNKKLKCINEGNFEFTKEHTRLSNINNSTIAEYFVNIKFCYLWNIKPIEAKNFVSTRMTMDLFPIYTAPGGQSDMHFTKENTFFSIETTIHNTVNNIIDHECRSSCEHLLSHNQTTNNNILILIVIKEFNRDNKLINYFKIHGSAEAKLKMKNFIFYLYNFAGLAEMSEFK